MDKKDRNIIIFVVAHQLILTGLIIFMSAITYPASERLSDILATRFLKQIHDEVMLYKEEKSTFPENLNDLLYYDAEKRTVYFQSKPLKGRLNYVWRGGFTEEEIVGSGINKLVHYKIMDDRPVIYILGYDGKEGGGDDCFYPSRFNFLADFFSSRFFVKTAIFSSLFAFAMSICMYRMCRRTMEEGNSITKAIFSSIFYLVFECAAAYAILILHIYPHH